MNKIGIICCVLLLGLSGCGRAGTNNIEQKNSAMLEDTTSAKILKMAVEKINEVQEKMKEEKSNSSEESRIGSWETAVLYGTYSKGIAIENREQGMFEHYEELIQMLSDAFEDGTIEEMLEDMKWSVKTLTEEEVQQIIQKETYGSLERLVEELGYGNSKRIGWYLIEQTDSRKDVIVQSVYEDGLVTYDTFKCKVTGDKELRAGYGLSAIADSEEHLFVEYKGLKYLCTPKRNHEGKIEGVAVHIYELKDYFGGTLYIEYTNEVRVLSYMIIVGARMSGDPYPDYLKD